MDDNPTFRHYLDCSQMPIWNFHQLGKTMDYRYLYKVDEIEEVDHAPIDAPKVWEAIFNEYCEISDNAESQEHLRQVAELDELEKKYVFASLIISELLSVTDDETAQLYFRELSAWGFAFNQGKLDTELKRAEVWLKSIKTRIGLLASDVRDHKSKQTAPERLERQQVKLERASGRNEIDVKRCSVAKWLEIIKDTEAAAREKEKQRKKAA